MQRVFTQDIKKGNREFAKKGDIRDYPLTTWKEIARSLFPRARNLMKALDKISTTVDNLGQAIGATK